jgi:protein SCO1
MTSSTPSTPSTPPTHSTTSAPPRTILIVLSGLLVLGLCALVLTLIAKQRLAQQRNSVTIVPLSGSAPALTQDIETSPDSSGLPSLFPAPKFSLTNQDEQPFTSDTLAGKPYIAAFMFTNCTTACPMMAGRMVSLQKIAPPGVRFVSFTVDPERDTPAVLKTYLTKFNADPNRWTYLTGPVPAMQAVETGFHVRLPKPPPDSIPNDATDPMLSLPHSDRFMLVDAKGNVRGIYDSKDETAMQKLTSDALRLLSTH